MTQTQQNGGEQFLNPADEDALRFPELNLLSQQSECSAKGKSVSPLSDEDDVYKLQFHFHGLLGDEPKA